MERDVFETVGIRSTCWVGRDGRIGSVRGIFERNSRLVCCFTKFKWMCVSAKHVLMKKCIRIHKIRFALCSETSFEKTNVYCAV